MYKLKSFVTIESFILNQVNAVSPIGEISTHSLTFAKDKGVYANLTTPELTLYAFSSTSNTTAGVVVPTAVSSKLFEVINWVHKKQIINGAPTDRVTFVADLVEQYGDALGSLSCGDMIEVKSGVWMPEWISGKVLGIVSTSFAYDNEVMVWLSNNSFAAQYDEYALTVIPPLKNIDAFFGTKASVVAALAARTLPQIMLEAQAAKGGFPETVVAAEEYNWVDPVSASLTPTSWTFLIYGAAGDNEDSIREAIRAYIAANSSHTEAEWKTIFPDIYKSTEFMIFPRWHNYAVADRVLQAGTYSPVVMMKKETTWLKARLTVAMGYSTAFIDTHASIMPTSYKSLALLITGGPDNRSSLFDITRVFPDIINVPTSDTLFELMAEPTQEWLLKLQAMLIVAEKASIYSVLPSGMQRLVRNGILYITSRYAGITYLVASKATTPV